MLTTNEEKRHMFEHLGIDYVVECPFTQEIMCMEPEDFIAKIVRQLHVKCMVVGEDFHFGCCGSMPENSDTKCSLWRK